MFAVALALRSDPFRWDLTGVLLFMLAGACATYLGRWFFFEAIARLGPAKASLFHVSSPAFTVIVAWLFLGEALPLLDAAGDRRNDRRVVPGQHAAGRACAHGPHPCKRARRLQARALRWKAWLASGFAVGIGATLAYSVGNVLRGASVRQWNEPVAGAMLGAVAALALHFVIGSGHRRLAARALRRRS